MFTFLKHLWSEQSQLASSGLLLMLMGGAGVSMRAVPAGVWGWIVQQTTLLVTVKDEDAAFQWVKEWFLEEKFLKRIRRVDLDTTLRGAEMSLLPAPGTPGLAGEFGLSVYVPNLTEMNDKSLKSAMNEVPGGSVVLFEDIDCMAAGHRRGEASAGTDDAARAPGLDRFHVTLSGLLNVLDGFHAPENVVYVMTTNDVDALDPALLRPGRIDYKLPMGYAGAWQKAELYRRFFPQAPRQDAERFAERHRAHTMAEFQGLLLQLDQGAACEALEVLQQEDCMSVGASL